MIYASENNQLDQKWWSVLNYMMFVSNLLQIGTFTWQLQIKRITTAQKINAKEYRSRSQKWKIQRNWQHRVHKTKKNKAKAQRNMRWSPQSANKTNNVNKT